MAEILLLIKHLNSILCIILGSFSIFNTALGKVLEIIAATFQQLCLISVTLQQIKENMTIKHPNDLILTGLGIFKMA